MRRLSRSTTNGCYDNESVTSSDTHHHQDSGVVDSALVALQKQLTSFTTSDECGAPGGPNSSGGPQERLGRIQFSVWYDFTASSLTLKIIQATDLPALDKNGTSDPYAKVVYPAFGCQI